jgi:hypothetical protein
MIVTDAVEPLSDQLKQNADKNLTLWGLYKIAVRIMGNKEMEDDVLC